jgi:hypothetical protein
MKIKKLIRITILIFTITTLVNCTVQKRSHRNGYYVCWNKKANQPLKTSRLLRSEQTNVVTPIVNAKAEVKNEQAPLFASSAKSADLVKTPLRIRSLVIEKDTCGDLITLRDGNEINAKVIEVGADEIKYKRCDNIDGPLFTVKTDNVFMIKYISGAKEVFEKKEVADPSSNLSSEELVKKLPEKRKNNKCAIWSFVTFCLFFLYITIPISFICGLIALIQHRNDPTRYKNMWMAYIPMSVFAFVILLLLIALIVFAL